MIHILYERPAWLPPLTAALGAARISGMDAWARMCARLLAVAE
jgi:hypothetical protein